jgi:hypothetical protein
MIRARWENKYIIGGAQEEWVRESVASHMRMDFATEAAPDHRYGVYSLYLDSNSLFTYWATNMGHRDRFKVRIRWYNSECKGPAFCEVKSRCADAMTKYRTRVKEQYLRDITEGGFPELDWLEKPSEENLAQALVFAHKCGDLQAVPAVGVGYSREAYVSDADEHLRITFDRQLVVHPPWHIGDNPLPDKWKPLRNKGTILEIKFKDTIARWVYDMVGKFNLYRTSFSKYAHSIEFLNLHRLTPAERFRPNGTYDEY